MKVLYLGDIVGRAGRDAVYKRLPELRDRLKPDFCVVNGENAAAGFGITPKICDELFDAGTDVIVTGNHVFDNVGRLSHRVRIIKVQKAPSARNNTDVVPRLRETDV